MVSAFRIIWLLNFSNFRIPREFGHVMTQLEPNLLTNIYRKQQRGALVRSIASGGMWAFALVAFFIGNMESHHLIGISASVAYLILVNPPALFLLRQMRTRRACEYFSLLINQLEILGYTAIIYFCGGIEATYLVLVYAVLISYVGIAAPRRHSYIVVTLCVLTFGSMVGLQYLGILPPMNLLPGPGIP